MAGVYQIPREFKDEDKWFKYFTKKQAVVVLICAGIDYWLVSVFGAKDLLALGFFLACLLTVVLVGGVMIVLPVDNFFLKGGGLTVLECLIRNVYRMKYRCLYTKNMDKGVWDESKV